MNPPVPPASEIAPRDPAASPPSPPVPAPGPLRGLPVRTASAAVLLVVVALVLLAGGVPLAVLVGVAAALAAWELRALLQRLPAEAPLWLVGGLAVWLAERPVLPGPGGNTGLILAAAVLGGVVAGVLLRVPWSGWAAGIAGGVYLGIGLGSLLALDHWPGAGPDEGVRILAVVIGAVIATDTLAYFTGMAVGRHRHPFFPALSPRKSREGAIGGVLGAVAVAGVAGTLWLGLGAALAVGLGLAVGIAAEAGDLAESALKRQAGVKDSGRLIPGHGGLLDRIDSLLLAGAAAYVLLILAGFH